MIINNNVCIDSIALKIAAGFDLLTLMAHLKYRLSGQCMDIKTKDHGVAKVQISHSKRKSD